MRPRLYGACELILDLAHSLRAQQPSLDLEALYICAIVTEATMRPMFVGPHASMDAVVDPMPPDHAHGGVSRLQIADRSGLSRETVRRKTNKLIKLGILIEENEGIVRMPRGADNGPAVTQLADESYRAVQRYERRLRAHGCNGVCSCANGNSG